MEKKCLIIITLLLLRSFPENEREGVLDIILDIPESKKVNMGEQKKQAHMIKAYDMDKILDCFDYNSKMIIFKKLYHSLKNDSSNQYVYISNIINKFRKEDWKEVFKTFIDIYSGDTGVYKYSSDIEIICTDLSNTLYALEMTFDLEKETGIQLFNGYTFVKLIEKFSIADKINIFKKYILEEKLIDIDDFVYSINDIDFKYSVLEVLIEVDYLKERAFEVVDNVIQRRNFDRFADGKINHSKINNLYCEKYNLNKENFDLLVNRFGYIVIKYLDNQNIVNAINLSREEFIKYIQIFNNEMMALSNDDINSVCNSLLQREFMLVNKEDYNIFSTIENIVSSNRGTSREELVSVINMMNTVVDVDKYLNKYEISRNEFIELLLANNSNTINILHEITNKYISVKREMYVNRRLININEELYLDKKIEKQYYKKAYISQFSDVEIRFDISCEIDKEELTEKQLELVKNRDLLSKLIAFKKEPSSTNLSKEEKEMLKIFESLLNILYEKQIKKDDIITNDTKYAYFLIPSTIEQQLNIMANINVQNLKDNVLSSEKVYDDLIEIINKYHFIGWHSTFTKLASSADIELSDGTFAGLISYFNEIYPKLNGDYVSLTKLLDYGNLYDYSSRRYRYMLGSEDYSLIAANEGKNKASATKHKRLEKSTYYVKKMYERKYTSIPPMNKDVPISNDKKINVVIGNSTNMMNLTYGERTNSCLRMFGAFDDTFDFCISDENGFHIRFVNPNTGKFVSRVSGIRNGNTIFLNELRESVDNTYDNEELHIALKEVADELIKESKKSNFPIDNVIITSDYALKEHESEEQPLNLNNDNSALYNLSFNIKVGSDKGIILTTSRDDGKLVPYVFDKDNTPNYECLRDEIKTFYGKHANDRIIQLHIINALLEEQNLEDIVIDDSVNYDFCISGEDFYIAITNDNKIIKYIMPNSKNRDKALEELNTCFEQIQKYVENRELERTVDGRRR